MCIRSGSERAGADRIVSAMMARATALTILLAGCGNYSDDPRTWRVSLSDRSGATWSGTISDGEIRKGGWWLPKQPFGGCVRYSAMLEGFEAVALQSDCDQNFFDLGEVWLAEINVFVLEGEGWSSAHRFALQERVEAPPRWGPIQAGLEGTILFALGDEYIQLKWDGGELAFHGELIPRSGGRPGVLLMSPDKTWGLLRDDDFERWDIVEWTGSRYELAAEDSSRSRRRSWPVIERDSEGNTLRILERKGAELVERDRVTVTHGRIAYDTTYFAQARTFAVTGLGLPNPAEGEDAEGWVSFSIDLERLTLHRIDTSNGFSALSMYFPGTPYRTRTGYRFIDPSQDTIHEDDLEVRYYYVDLDLNGVPLGPPGEALFPGSFPMDPRMSSSSPSWTEIGRAPLRDE